MLLGLLVQVIVIAVEDHLTRESVGKLGRTTRLRHNVARHAGRARPTVPPDEAGPASSCLETDALRQEATALSS